MLKNMKHVTTTEDAHVAKELKLPAEITDLKCRSMRDNLLVFSIPEENNENCDNKIVDLIVRHKTSYTKCIRGHKDSHGTQSGGFQTRQGKTNCG